MTQTLSIPQLVDSTLFSCRHVGASWLMTAEASDLGLAAAPSPEIVVKSHKTGNCATFIRNSVTVDREGEVQAWNYINTNLNCRLTIFND